MARRYLSFSEAKASLNRGKPVECFVGKCSKGTTPGIEWLSISKGSVVYKASIYRSADFGNEEYIDVYSFGPLDENLEYEEPDEILETTTFEELMDVIYKKYSQIELKLVNQFVVQDEYSDYVKSGRAQNA